MEEVLPTIRKNGAYMTTEVINKTLEDPDFIIEMATKLKKEREEKLLAQRRIENLEATITIDKPYTNFGKSIASSSDAITIGQFAKILNNNNIKIGRNRLFNLLRENGYLIKVGKEKNTPKQVYIEQGLFTVSENVVHTSDGDILKTTTLITGKGQMYFEQRIKQKKEERCIVGQINNSPTHLSKESDFWTYWVLLIKRYRTKLVPHKFK